MPVQQPLETKRIIIQQLEGGSSQAKVAKTHGISRRTISRISQEYRDGVFTLEDVKPDEFWEDVKWVTKLHVPPVKGTIINGFTIGESVHAKDINETGELVNVRSILTCVGDISTWIDRWEYVIKNDKGHYISKDINILATTTFVPEPIAESISFEGVETFEPAGEVIEEVFEPEVEYVITGSNISIDIDGETFSVGRDAPFFNDIRQALIDEDFSRIPELVDVRKTIHTYSNGLFKVEGDDVTYNGKSYNSNLTKRIVHALEEGADEFYILTNFFNRLVANVDERVITELFDFLGHNDIKLNEDGTFNAWKRVRENYMDCHSGTFDNSPGKVVSMPRDMVDDDKHKTCSAGLHVCAESYIKSFWGDRVVEVKVDPVDVISVPVDYHGAKMRTCKYTVIADVTERFL